MPVIQYQKTPTSDKPWDGAANIKNLKSGQPETYYNKMFAWKDPEGNPETKGCYKFPHHECSTDGSIGSANIKACQSAISVLNGGMGGADIPDTDRKGVYDHVAHHLKDANIEPDKLKRSKSLKDCAEMRSFSMPDLTAEPEGNVVQGHAAVFGQPTSIYGMFNEVIERGAFDKTDFTDVLFSINHDLSKIPLARSRNNNANSTLQLQVDDQGLNTKATLDVENNNDAKALYSAIGRGDINGMSFIFFVRGETWENEDTDTPTRRITDISKVVEVSAVSSPFYDGTDINARDKRALDSAAQALESARSIKLDSSKSEQEEERQAELQEQANEIELLKLKGQILAKG